MKKINIGIFINLVVVFLLFFILLDISLLLIGETLLILEIAKLFGANELEQAKISADYLILSNFYNIKVSDVSVLYWSVGLLVYTSLTISLPAICSLHLNNKRAYNILLFAAFLSLIFGGTFILFALSEYKKAMKENKRLPDDQFQKKHIIVGFNELPDYQKGMRIDEYIDSTLYQLDSPLNETLSIKLKKATNNKPLKSVDVFCFNILNNKEKIEFEVIFKYEEEQTRLLKWNSQIR